MRKYFDAEGRPTTADKAVSSKGGQGNAATFFKFIFLSAVLVFAVAGCLAAIHGG